MMKKNNKYVSSCRSDREGKLTRENPIHYYGEKQTIIGRVSGEYRRFSRPGGSSQYVFRLAAPNGPDKQGFCHVTQMELYMNAGGDTGEVNRMLQDGQMLKIDFCRRYDVYIDRDGELAERSFLFINGTEDIQLLEDTAATA